MSPTLEFARELIRRPSVTPDDAGCQELIGSRLAAAGFHLEVLRFGGVTNLWARRGTSGPLFCFAGHTDVVPAGPPDAWQTEPFEPVIRDGILFGRGAADMKAALAAMVDAAADYVAAYPQHKGSIAFLITSDEEGRAQDGTKRVMHELVARGERIDWCLIGEPSCEKKLGDTLRVGRRGSLTGILTVHGIAGHVAYPHLASNPIRSFAPVLAELYRTPLDEGNEYFPPSSFQVVQLESIGGAVNVTPDSLRARFNVRYSTVWTHETLQRHVESVLEGHGLDYAVDWRLSGEPFLTPPAAFVQATRSVVREVTGMEPQLSTGGGTSDGRFIAPTGTHVVEFGAVNATIHKPDEQIPVNHVDTLRRVYRGVLERMLA